MAAPGGSLNQTVELALAPEAVSQTLVQAVAGAPECTVTTAGVGSIVVSRKYLPTWAIVVGVIGLLLFLIGALAFLIRSRETLTITIAPTEGGSRVSVSGVASRELAQRLQAALGALPALTKGSGEQAALSTADATPSSVPDEKVCPECAETVKAAAQVCRFCGYRFEQAADAA
jgi:Uncharacterised protein family UPF0547